jgi:transposase
VKDEVQPADVSDERAHSTCRKTARSRPIEIITRGERRRPRTLEQKRKIVAEILGCEPTATESVGKHGISSGQLYTWRRQLLDSAGALLERAVSRFSKVDLAPPSASAGETAPPHPAAPQHAIGVIEIVPPSSVSLGADARCESPIPTRRARAPSP